MPVNFQGKTNTYLQIKDYKAAAKHVMDFVHKAEHLGARVGMDNAVPICMFTSEELSELMVKEVVAPSRNFICYPAIDIGPDLSVWRCFGTSKLFNKKLEDFNSLKEMFDYYQRVSRLYQFKFFPLTECDTCEHAKKERCQGGCIGFAEAKCEELGISVSEPSDKELLQMKPKLSNQVSIRRYSLPEETTTINFHDGCEIRIPSSIAELIALFNGKTTILQALNTKISGNPQPRQTDELDELMVELSSQEVLPIIRQLLEKQAIISNKTNQN
jgi:hypothetical protein